MLSALSAFNRDLEAVIFDFDGVIVESLDIKSEAFRDLFAGRPERLGDILALHRQHAGVDRFTKLEMIYRDILHENLSDTNKQALADRFAALVEERVTVCPLVPGAAELLAALEGRVAMAVISATPHAELQRIVDRRGLTRYFDAVHGSPPDKISALRALLAAKHWDVTRVLMVGDAVADYDAARDNKISFIGRLPPGEPNPFPADVTTVPDLAPLARATTAFATMP